MIKYIFCNTVSRGSAGRPFVSQSFPQRLSLWSASLLLSCAVGVTPYQGQASESVRSSGLELSSVPLFVSGSSGEISCKNLGDSHSSPMTLAVVCSPPRPSVFVDHGSERSHADIEMDSTSFMKKPSRNQVSFSESFSSHPLGPNRFSYPPSSSNQVARAVVCPPPGTHSSIEEEPLDVSLNPLDRSITGVQGHEEFPKTSANLLVPQPFDIASLSPAVTTFLSTMDWTIKDLQDHGISIAVLDKILPIETRIMPNFLRWASIDRWGARLFHLPLLDFGGLGHSAEGLKLQGKKSWSRFWMQGRSLPLKSGYTLRKAVGSDAFREGLEFGIAKGLNLTLAAILMYQITQPSDNIIAVYQSSSTNSILALSDYFKNNPAIFSVFTFPPVYGLLKAVSSLRVIDASLTLKDIKEAEKIFEDLPPTFWSTYLRGLLPFHPLQSSLQKFEQRLTWEGRRDECGQQEREAAYQLIEKVARQGKGFTQTEGFYGLARLAYGLNLKDLPRLKGAQDNNSLLHRLSLKTRAFESLATLHPDARLTKLYQDYYLWSLGHSPSFWKTSIPMATLKAVRLTTQVFSLWAICKAISDYFNCPDKPGLSFTGYQPWSSSYSQSCFDELVRQFNIIPGQPVHTLIDMIPQYHFPENTYHLDLSHKGLKADVLVDLIQGFQRHYQQGTGPLLIALNLEGSDLGTPESLGKVLSIIPSKVKALDLSSTNTYGYSYAASLWEQALAQNLPQLSFLESLSLRDNYIDYHYQTNGTQELARQLGKFENLRSLDLSHNAFGRSSNRGTLAISQALSNLTLLSSLDLSWNNIGFMDDIGTQSLGKSLSHLGDLQVLNLGVNCIGYRGYEGVVALGTALSQLQKLSWLSLRRNSIVGGMGTVVQGLYQRTSLTYLDLSYTGIGLIKEDVDSLAKTLTSLSSLKQFFVLPSYLTSQMAQTLNAALASNSNMAPLPMPLSDPNAVRAFFETVPLNTTVINLSGRVRDDRDTVTTLMQYLANYSALTDLDLSNNPLGFLNSSVIVALGKGLGNLKKLTKFNISFDSTEVLDSNGSVALAEGIGEVKTLTSLDMSFGNLGFVDDRGVQALGKSLRKLSQLSYLNLYWNSIGLTEETGTIEIGRSLSDLQSLRTLNLGGNWIGLAGDEGTVEIGKGIARNSLTSLDLSYNSIGSREDKGTIEIGKALSHSPYLQKLDLSRNIIGSTTDLGTEAIGQSLRGLLKLVNLDLSRNSIGSTGKNGSQIIVSALPKLTSLSSINLGGMKEVDWTEGAQAISFYTSQKLLAACESQLCYGTSIASSSSAASAQKVSTSSATRLQAPWPIRMMESTVKALSHTFSSSYYAVIQKLSEYSPVSAIERIVSDSYDAIIDSTTESLREVTANSPAYFPNINHSYISDWQPNPFMRTGQQSVDYATLTPYVLQQSIGGYSTPTLSN